MVCTTMAIVTGTFKIRRYWFVWDIPECVIAQLNVKWGFYPKDGAQIGRAHV